MKDLFQIDSNDIQSVSELTKEIKNHLEPNLEPMGQRKISYAPRNQAHLLFTKRCTEPNSAYSSAAYQ